MKQMKRFLIACFCCCLLLTCVYAAGMGALNILATDSKDAPLEGIAVRMACVADADGKLTDAFSGANISPAALANTEAAAANAKTLYSYVQKHGIKGAELLTDKNGKGSFDDLDEAIYLVWAGDNEELTFSPFLAFVPTVVNGEPSWLVKATLKVGKIPDNPTSGGPVLPQTGIDKMPMYLLCVFGTLFVVLGTVMILRGKDREQNE